MKSSIGSKMNLLSIVTVILVVSIIMTNISHAKPSGFFSNRQKRVSDQRLAELETLLSLSRMRGKLVTVPIGFGRVDPDKLGRRRRSNVESSLVKLQRFLQAMEHNSNPANTDDSDEAFPLSWNVVEDDRALEITDQSI